ncbi:MAG: 4-alpha-glucanotransferase [Sulfuricurvum sp. PC08-66]|nr:MAG: 4-alpha-glucanotransferase [Sulfuricurvum sp. PC08-66]
MKTALLFGIHMHQPVDNFDWVIDHAVKVCYAPFFEVASRYPSFKFAVHCSGWLLEQIAAKHPALHSTMMQMARQGTIEFFTAGYYEPILSTIPSVDRVAQITKLSHALTAQSGQTPQGMWLTERVWESSVIPDAAQAGVRYSVIDDYHFMCAGFEPSTLDGYYLTEEGGVDMGLFPISKSLRYALPFLKVSTAIERIKAYHRLEDSAAIIFDDAEKFGMWPGTHEWVYAKGWLEAFIQGVLADEAITPMHFGEYYKAHKPRGVAYLPNVSYYEMGQWSLNAEDALRLEGLKNAMPHEEFERVGVKFLKGGVWKNFLVKYSESNRIHKRMLELSHARLGVNKPAFDEALYKLQTNDALWHGVFGGLYLPNLRDNAYAFLIEAETIRYGKTTAILEDSNERDGYAKIKAVTQNFILRWESALGGQLVELDDKKHRFNYQNTLTRRKEAYHHYLFDAPKAHEESVQKEEGIDTIHNAAAAIDPALRAMLHYDWHLKHAFIDHIVDESLTALSLYEASYREWGDFANQPFEASYDATSIRFVRDGGIYDEVRHPTRLQKQFFPFANGVDFAIALRSEAPKALSYAIEHNLHFSDYTKLTLNDLAYSGKMAFESMRELVIVDGHLGRRITLSCDRDFRLLVVPLDTLSQSEQGFDVTIQGITIVMVFAWEGDLALEGRLEIVDV